MQGYDYFHKCLPSCHLQQQKCVFVIITNLCILPWPTSWLATDVWHCYKPKTKADCRGSTNIAHSWLIFHSDWVYSAKISHFKKTLKLKSGMVKLWLFGSFWGQNPLPWGQMEPLNNVTFIILTFLFCFNRDSLPLCWA